MAREGGKHTQRGREHAPPCVVISFASPSGSAATAASTRVLTARYLSAHFAGKFRRDTSHSENTANAAATHRNRQPTVVSRQPTGGGCAATSAHSRDDCIHPRLPRHCEYIAYARIDAVLRAALSQPVHEDDVGTPTSDTRSHTTS
jgi:hypothetical protein